MLMWHRLLALRTPGGRGGWRTRGGRAVILAAESQLVSGSTCARVCVRAVVHLGKRAKANVAKRWQPRTPVMGGWVFAVLFWQLLCRFGRLGWEDSVLCLL